MFKICDHEDGWIKRQFHAKVKQPFVLCTDCHIKAPKLQLACERENEMEVDQEVDLDEGKEKIL